MDGKDTFIGDDAPDSVIRDDATDSSVSNERRTAPRAVAIRHQTGAFGLFLVAGSHALVTWPLVDALALFVGGGALAAVLEVIGVGQGLHEHYVHPQVAGVPVHVVIAWPAIVYVTYRFALLGLPAGAPAAAGAAVLATACDFLGDPQGVREGAWTYPEHPLSSPRYKGVPWWNFLAWLGIVFATAMLPTLVG